MKVVTILVRDHKREKKFSIKLDSQVFSLYNSEKGKKKFFWFYVSVWMRISPPYLRFLLFFFFSASCTVYGTWTVHLDLWIVTCIIHALKLHCTGDIVHCSCTVYAQFTTHNHFIQKNIKNGSRVLFIHLKIILLQCF